MRLMSARSFASALLVTIVVSLPLGLVAARQASSDGESCEVTGKSMIFSSRDADFDSGRRWVNAMLDASLAKGQDARMASAVAYRIPAEATGFAVMVDSAQCHARLGPKASQGRALAAAPRLAASAEDATTSCEEPGCSVGFPGNNSPDGSLMTLVTCTQSLRTTTVYERVDGQWVIVSIKKEFVTSCTLGPPAD